MSETPIGLKLVADAEVTRATPEERDAAIRRAHAIKAEAMGEPQKEGQE